MAADDEDRGPAPDPWEEIVAEGLEAESGEMAFRFDDPAAATPDDGGAAGTDEAVPGAGGTAEPSSSTEAAEEALVEDWLSGDPAESGVGTPPLSVFAPEETAGGSSAIDIGTGMSGIGLHGAPDHEEIGGDAFAGLEADESAEPAAPFDVEPALGEFAGVGGEDGAAWSTTAGLGAAAGATAARTVSTKTSRHAAKPARKSGGLGQVVGIVAGGLMAIPITMAILIYGLGKDPFGVTKALPPQVAFLLPKKFQPGYKKPSAKQAADVAVAGGSALDELPSAPEPGAASPEPTVPEGDEPAPLADAAPAEPEPAEPPAPVVEPVPDPTLDVAAVAAPGLDDLVAPPQPAAPAEPPPLDTATLDEAVADAVGLGVALCAVEDRENGAYKKLRTRWYRALARMAEELVAVENVAATSGRPLAGAPDNVAALHGGIGGREALAAELAALAPDWLAYAKRGSDGVVLPVTFEEARKVGPYWSVRASLTGADGTLRELRIVSRTEPVAITGDRVVVTGVALDGTVIWAADVRSVDAGGGQAPGF